MAGKHREKRQQTQQNKTEYVYDLSNSLNVRILFLGPTFHAGKQRERVGILDTSLVSNTKVALVRNIVLVLNKRNI